jgi:hypothetical protein
MPYYIIRKVDEQERDQQYNDLPGWEIDRWLQDLAGADHVIGPIALPGDAHQKKNAIEAEGSIADPITVRFYADEQERSDWRRREERKFSSGEYIRVPWADIEAYNLRDHFVHLSRKTPGMIAYTANEEHGVRDRQTTIRPGRYLQQFYPDMLKERIDRFCGMCSVADLDLKITNDPEEIVTVYTMPNGPDSCMSHRSDSYSGDVHPVSVYTADRDPIWRLRISDRSSTNTFAHDRSSGRIEKSGCGSTAIRIYSVQRSNVKDTSKAN